MKISNETNNKILSTIKGLVLPDLKIVLMKVFGIHILTSLITLLVCPQLGFSLIESKVNLMDVFMKVGPHFCDFACGVFFTSTSILSIFLFLSRDEFSLLRFKPFFMLSTMTLTSLGFLLMLNPNMFIQFTFLWLIGTVVGVIGTIEIGFRLARKAI